jgi:uncharacterized membrane protein
MRTSLIVSSALAAALSLPFAAMAQQAGGPAPTPTFKAEKCYAIAKAGKNDCQTNTSSCAGTSKRDRQADAWIYVPAGSCSRIDGGVLKS